MLSLPIHVAGCVCALSAAGAAFGGPTVEAVWLPLEIDLVECPELADHGSADLYLAFDVDPGNTIAVTSDATTGIEIMGGVFRQDETGTNGPRPEGWFEVFPCARWDSYLTIGGGTPFFSPEFPPEDEMDWGPRIEAEWLPQPGEGVTPEVDPVKFGDARFYVRIARITGSPGTMSVAGTIDVVYFPFPDMPTVAVEETIQVMNCAPCWGSVDLDGDGVIGSGDLAILLASWGACGGCPADLNGDGVVDSGDLAMLLAAWG